MRKYLTLIIMVTYLIGNAQCSTPSNLTVTYTYPLSAELNWTENGSAASWDIAIIPDFVVGTPPPTSALYTSSSTTFLLNNLSPGCYAFFVRSSCSIDDVSPWTAVSSIDCSYAVYLYLNTLSNDSFSLNSDNNELKIYPNPVKNNFTISNINQTTISSLQIFNTLGQLVQINTNQNETIDVSELKTGNYFIKIVTDKGMSSGKFWKE